MFRIQTATLNTVQCSCETEQTNRVSGNPARGTKRPHNIADTSLEPFLKL